MTTDTEIIENIIIAEALDSGRTFDLRPADFSDVIRSTLWERMLEAKQANDGQLDHIILDQHLKHRHGIDLSARIDDYRRAHVGSPNITGYVAQLKEAAAQRRMKTKIAGLQALKGTAAELKAKAIDELKAIDAGTNWTLLTSRTALASMVDEISANYHAETIPGVTTGIPRLDEKTGGWHKSDLNLIAARPSVGKTALMIDLIMAAIQKRRLVISAEMPATQIMQRMVSKHSRIDAWKLRNPKEFSNADWEAFSASVAALTEQDLHIYDASSPDIERVRMVIEHCKPDVVFVDYVQRLKGKGVGVYERVSSIANGLKEAARDYNVPVVALAQINRAGDSGATMAHLKGSGDLEQEADTVAILERENGSDIASLNLAKNRHGPTGDVPLTFDRRTMTFAQMA